jgi:acyl carrier protein
MSATADRLAALLISRFGVTEGELSPHVTFAELDLDSLALVEFAMVAEKEFAVPLGEDELSPSDTLAAAVELIDRKLAIETVRVT